MRRIIREEEPPRPSTRLSTLGDDADDRRRPARHRPEAAEPARARRAGLDRDEVPGEGPHAPLRDGQRPRGGRAALPGRRAGAGVPAVGGYRFRKFARRNKAVLTTVSLIALALVVGTVVSIWQARAERAEVAIRGERDRALAAEAKTRAHAQVPAIEAYLRARQYSQAFDLLRQVEAVIPDDSRLPELRTECSWELTIRSNPPGATVLRRPPDAAENAWDRLGVTPIEKRRLRAAFTSGSSKRPDSRRRKASRSKARSARRCRQMGGVVQVDLDPQDAAPGMVRVRPLAAGFFWMGRVVEIPPFWLDRFEVTNRQFKQFVDQGGYRRRELWEQPVERDGKTLSWEESMELFRDTTGAGAGDLGPTAPFRRARTSFRSRG